MFLGLTANGTPRITLMYADGKGSIQLEANNTLNTAGLLITGPTGKVQVVLAIDRKGAPVIALLDENGKVLFPRASSDSDDTSTPQGGFDWDTLLGK
jgi:hypothetical protein